MAFKIGDNDDPNVPASGYSANSLNQYFDVASYSPFVKRKMTHDADGNLSQAYAVGDIDGDGDVDIADLTMLSGHFGDTCPGTSPGTTLTAAQFAPADYNGDCLLTFTDDFAPLLSGYGSNQIGSYVGYTWDGENRLTRVEPLARDASSGAIDASLHKVEFGYDYMGRRVEKRVYKRDSSNNANWGSNPIERRRFVWNGWLMLRETIETDANADGDFVDTGDSTRTKTYAWGRDLSASGRSCGTGLQPVSCLELAGGIGGLLSVYDDNATTSGSDDLTYIYCYDANGNVGQVCNLSATSVSASLVAKYEYDAFGNLTTSSGTYATANTYRFSTKPWDDETGLGYWGYRYYEPRMGRWLNRDPLEEQGGINVYVYTKNDGLNHWDMLGKYDCRREVCRSYAPPPSPSPMYDPVPYATCINACEYSQQVKSFHVCKADVCDRITRPSSPLKNRRFAMRPPVAARWARRAGVSGSGIEAARCG